MAHSFRHAEGHDDCLFLRPTGDDDELFHLSEWQYGVGLLVKAIVPTMAFYVLRHLAELVQKRIVSEVIGTYEFGHDLCALLNSLPEDDPLRVGSREVEVSIRELILAIGDIDSSGVAARYAFDRSGRPSFDDEVCIQPEALEAQAEMLWEYCLERAGGWHAPTERP
jgi:hypothetical protein